MVVIWGKGGQQQRDYTSDDEGVDGRQHNRQGTGPQVPDGATLSHVSKHRKAMG